MLGAIALIKAPIQSEIVGADRQNNRPLLKMGSLSAGS
jgi:hypothetical protein